MRRAARLTAGKRKIKVGFNGQENNFVTNRKYSLNFNPADGTGILEDVTVKCSGSAAVRMFTAIIAESGNTFTIQTVAAAQFSISSGTNVLAGINLPITIDHHLGLYVITGTMNITSLNGFGGAYGYTTTTTAPSVGAQYPYVTTTNDMIHLSSGY